MKPMSLFLMASLLTCTLSNVSSQNLVVQEKQKIEITFNCNTTFGDLTKTQEELKQKGITLDFEKIEFDESHKLKCLSIIVDCHDGFVGKASLNDFTGKKRIGFYRDYTPDNLEPFYIGSF